MSLSNIIPWQDILEKNLDESRLLFRINWTTGKYQSSYVLLKKKKKSMHFF